MYAVGISLRRGKGAFAHLPTCDTSFFLTESAKVCFEGAEGQADMGLRFLNKIYVSL